MVHLMAKLLDGYRAARELGRSYVPQDTLQPASASIVTHALDENLVAVILGDDPGNHTAQGMDEGNETWGYQVVKAG